MSIENIITNGIEQMANVMEGYIVLWCLSKLYSCILYCWFLHVLNIELLTTVNNTPNPPPPVFDRHRFFLGGGGSVFLLIGLSSTVWNRLCHFVCLFFYHGNHRYTNYQSDKFGQIWDERWDLQGQITLKLCDIWSLEWTQNMFCSFLDSRLEPHKSVWSMKKKNLRTMTTANPLTPPWFDSGQKFNGFCCCWNLSLFIAFWNETQ